MKEYLPTSWTNLAAWMANFAAQLPSVAGKYGLTANDIDAVQKDSQWIQYWVDAKTTAKQQEKQLTDFVDEITDGDYGAPTPTAPVWALPPTPPPVPPVGIKKRIREIVAGIKAKRSVYTLADGELLGIVSPEEAGRNETDYTPTLKIAPLRDYHLSFEFRREGLDAVRFEVKRKGGEWRLLGDAAISPTDFLVTPTTPGDAEQIEIRAVFLKQYQPFGSWSPIYTTTIAP